MHNQNVLIIADHADAKILDMQAESKRWNVFWKTLSYNELHRKIPEIHAFNQENNVDFVLYSRNDQVANRTSIGSITRALRTGYSSFSGIDNPNRLEQMKTCFEDFLECNRQLIFKIEPRPAAETRPNPASGTFSLIFDTEQLGGCRYGLPRILSVLDAYSVKATFFFTNLMKRVYPTAFELTKKKAHEIGIHGKWHEDLSLRNSIEQAQSLNEMKNDLCSQVHGANFIGRMNESTVSAMVSNRIEYFLFPSINYYRFSSYPKMPTTPFKVDCNEGTIWALPVLVETYNLPWLSIKNMLDSAIWWTKKTGSNHITVLLHPFRDGNLQHLKTTQKLMDYLTTKKAMSPITLKQFIDRLKPAIDFPKVKLEDSRITAKTQPISRFPRTKEDLLGMYENYLVVNRYIYRNRAIF